MKEHRSVSQVLFGFLPEQTVDLRGKVWKVKEWRRPYRIGEIDDGSIRRTLLRQLAPWAAADKDGGFARDIARGKRINVVRVDRDNGVLVEPFPQVWLCRSCKRVLGAATDACRCGDARPAGQLHFVGYHDACGAIRAPFIPKCPEHRAARVNFPGTASAAEITFSCPDCGKELGRGFGFPRCSCGSGHLVFNVHRAAAVYTAHSLVLVNPPSKAKLKELTEAGGPARALEWVTTGMSTRSPFDSQATAAQLRQVLEAQGLDPGVITQMLGAAEASGQLSTSVLPTLDLPAAERQVAEDEAVTIALATSESRVTIGDLQATAPDIGERRLRYVSRYPEALRRAGLARVELVEKFPVLTGQFGYTRGGNSSSSKLVGFRDSAGNYTVFADLAETEAWLIQLEPERVLRWLRRRGLMDGGSTAISPELAVLDHIRVPVPGVKDSGNPSGQAVLELVHSYAHKLIRKVAVFAGTEVTSLAELLTPHHLGFFIYAAARGDFVLGGLQAAFESDLDQLLDTIVEGDGSCPLDPGCTNSGGACMACLHLGEPCCRLYNGYLSRSVLTGLSGYLTID